MSRTLLPALALLLSGCALVGGTPAPTAQPSRTPVLFTEPADTALPPATETPRPISPACRPDVTGAQLASADYDAYPQAILGYLNAGGSPVALSGLLNARGVGAQPITAIVDDFTGDGRDDVAVALADPREEDLDGRLVVYACGLADYEIVLNRRAGEGFTRGFRIWLWRDLDGDGRVDLVAGRELCGAHTCFQDVDILGYDGAGFTDRLAADTSELPFPAVRAADPDGDGFFDLEIGTAGFGSVGAGPQRPITYVYGYDPGAGAWALSLERPDPSPYRIHILHDADAAAARAEYDYAIALYRRVIDEPGLDDWTAGEEGRLDLAAYARFRIFAIAVALQDPAGIGAALAELEASHPVGDPRRDFVEMAILFRNAYNSGGLGAACTAAAGFAESHAGTILEPLGSGVYGYANQDYTGESMCPAPEVGG